MNIPCFNLGQVVWAKSKCSAWLPARILKSFAETNDYLISYYGGENVTARVNVSCIKDYEENFSDFSTKRTAGLKKAIKDAYNDLEKHQSSTFCEISNIEQDCCVTNYHSKRIRKESKNFNKDDMESIFNYSLSLVSKEEEINLSFNYSEEELNKAKDFISPEDLDFDENENSNDFDYKFEIKVDNEKSTLKDEPTNDETSIKINHSVQEEEHYTTILDDINFMLNFIVNEARLSSFSKEKLLGKYKKEVTQVIKQLIEIKDRDRKVFKKKSYKSILDNLNELKKIKDHRLNRKINEFLKE